MTPRKGRAAPEGTAQATWQTSDNIIQPTSDKEGPLWSNPRPGASLTGRFPVSEPSGSSLGSPRPSIGADAVSSPGQGLSNPTRFSPATVQAWLVLPASTARDFAVATALGSAIKEPGSRDELRRGETGIAVMLGKVRRRQIIDTLNITPRHWRRLVGEWKTLRLAHRCTRDQLCLFVCPDAVCPNCGELIETEADGLRPPWSPKADGLRPPSGQIRSAFEHETGMQEGMQRSERDARGVGASRKTASDASSSSVSISEEGSANRGAAVENRWRCECGTLNPPGRPCWAPGRHPKATP
jgi:hypothetical protein